MSQNIICSCCKKQFPEAEITRAIPGRSSVFTPGEALLVEPMLYLCQGCRAKEMLKWNPPALA